MFHVAESRPVAVVGAGGYVGSHLVRRLEAEGRPVRRLARPEIDLTRPETLKPALEGAAVVVHAAAITGDRKEPYRGAYREVNQVGTENLVRAAREAGVERLVVMSGLGLRPAPEGTYMATRWGLEEAVRAGGIPYVILRPSVLFGEGAAFTTALAGLAASFPVVPLLGGGDTRFQPLWIEDLVSCLAGSLGSGAPLGREVALGGAEVVSFRHLMDELCRAAGKRRLMLPLPLWVARPQARLMAALMSNPPLTPAAVELFGLENVAGEGSVEKVFGFRPRGFTEHVRSNGLR